MPTFNQALFDTAFSAETLTSVLNTSPFTPQVIAQQKMFSESGMPTLKAVIELIKGRLTLLPSLPRGAPGTVHQRGTRSAVEVSTAHFLPRSTIVADSLQDVRGWGTVSLETVEAARNRDLEGFRASIEASIEYQRIGAIKGLVLDGAGNTTLDVFATFDETQQTQDLALTTSTTNVTNVVTAAVRKSEDAIGLIGAATSYIALAAPDFMDVLRAHPSVEAALANWAAANMMLADVRPGILNIGGVKFIEYRTPTGTPTRVESGCAYLCPQGVPGLYISRFAPADYFESVNNDGLPMYAKAVMDGMGRSIDMEGQSNPISLVTRPSAIVKLTA